MLYGEDEFVMRPDAERMFRMRKAPHGTPEFRKAWAELEREEVAEQNARAEWTVFGWTEQERSDARMMAVDIADRPEDRSVYDGGEHVPYEPFVGTTVVSRTYCGECGLQTRLDGLCAGDCDDTPIPVPTEFNSVRQNIVVREAVTRILALRALDAL